MDERVTLVLPWMEMEAEQMMMVYPVGVFQANVVVLFFPQGQVVVMQ